MGLECISELSHTQHVNALQGTASTLTESNMEDAVKKVKLAYGKSNSDIVDVAVSNDGTWQKRGHTSKHGLGIVIEVSTGLMVDYHVMSKHCQAKIATLQGHYRKAVASSCKTVEDLRKLIWRTYKHSASTDDAPQHENCPIGTGFWCFYQRAIAFGHTPPSHKGKSNSFISPTIANYVRKVHERLTSDALLEWCLKGLTQNNNESIHATIWVRCPKHLFSGKRRIDIATAIAVGNFNSGSKSLQKLMVVASCTVASQTIIRGMRRHRKRVWKADKKEKVEVNRKRTEIALATTKVQQEYLCRDGVSYAPGEF